MNNAYFDQRMDVPPSFRQCFGCNYEAVTVSEACPRCRKNKFFTSRSIRIRGALMLGVGLFLVTFMGAIAVSVGLLLFGAAHDPQTAQKFNGEFGQLVLVYCIFGAVIAFGANAAVSGSWMLIAGKRNRLLLWLMWVLLGTIMIGGGVVEALL